MAAVQMRATQNIAYLFDVNAELLAAYMAFACAQVCGSESVELKAQGEEGKDSLPRAEVGARSKATPTLALALAPTSTPSPNPDRFSPLSPTK